MTWTIPIEYEYVTTTRVQSRSGSDANETAFHSLEMESTSLIPIYGSNISI